MQVGRREGKGWITRFVRERGRVAVHAHPGYVQRRADQGGGILDRDGHQQVRSPAGRQQSLVVRGNVVDLLIELLPVRQVDSSRRRPGRTAAPRPDRSGARTKQLPVPRSGTGTACTRSPPRAPTGRAPAARFARGRNGTKSPMVPWPLITILAIPDPLLSRPAPSTPVAGPRRLFNSSPGTAGP